MPNERTTSSVSCVGWRISCKTWPALCGRWWVGSWWFNVEERSSCWRNCEDGSTLRCLRTATRRSPPRPWTSVRTTPVTVMTIRRVRRRWCYCWVVEGRLVWWPTIHRKIMKTKMILITITIIMNPRSSNVPHGITTTYLEWNCEVWPRRWLPG